MTTTKTRPIFEIAREINKLWKGKGRVYADPYIQAMHSLGSVTDNYGLDTGDSIVRYFLSNASTWRGEDARRIKAELKGML